ncbi:hypothetical protein PsorP6_016809 [Peronosclerospora sorghi]|uniref:Uncharacterized protein n=1 Tax=Peronosclerospora sorghi TaxID=230839 RepID=A0ACC0WEI7_9STRA|nr:hypothetical protein PsorP6_016809 [Peronosclerospora sorghi]
MDLKVELTGATTNAERVGGQEVQKVDMFVAHFSRPALTYDGFIVPETRSRMKNHDYTLFTQTRHVTNVTFLVQVAVEKSTRVACAKADEVIENFLCTAKHASGHTKERISYELDTVTQRYVHRLVQDSQRIAGKRTWKQKLSKFGIKSSRIYRRKQPKSCSPLTNSRESATTLLVHLRRLGDIFSELTILTLLPIWM